MPVYTIETPSGHQLDIDAPDQETALKGAQEWHAQTVAAPDATTDAVKQFASGVMESPENLLATPARISNLAQRGINWAVHKIAPDSALDKAGQDIIARNEGLSNAIYNNVPAPSKYLPQPETTAGQFARSVGNFAPDALTGGGGLLARALRMALPGVASEGAGQIADAVAPEYTPAARIAGAMLTSGLGKSAKPASYEDVGNLKNAEYDKFWNKSNDVTVDPLYVKGVANSAMSELTQRGMDNEAAANRLKPLLKPNGPVPIGRLEQTAQTLRDDGNAPGTAGEAGRTARGYITGLMDKLDSTNVVKGVSDLPEVMTTLNNARTLARVQAQLKLAERGQEAGEANADASHSGENKDNALRRRAVSLYNNEDSARTLKDYLPQLKAIYQGNTGINALRYTGNLLHGVNRFLGPLMGAEIGAQAAGATGAAVGGVLGLGIPIVGSLLKRYEGKLTQNKFNNLRYDIASKAPGVTQTPATALKWRHNALLNAALAAGQRQ